MSSEQFSEAGDGIPLGILRYEASGMGKVIDWEVGDINPVSFRRLPEVAVLSWPTTLKPSEFLNSTCEILGIEQTPPIAFTDGPASRIEMSIDSLVAMDKAGTKVPEVVRMDCTYVLGEALWQTHEDDLPDNPIRLVWECFDGQSFVGGIFTPNIGIWDIRTLFAATGSDAVKANIDGLVKQVFLEDISLSNRLN